MGQAAVDLPDPLEMSQGTGLAGTDDLLAQLAGDEIDRLLAEANEDSAPSPNASGAAADVNPAELNVAATAAPSASPSAEVAQATPASNQATPASNQATPASNQAAPASNQAAPSVAASPATPAPAVDELDALLTQLNASATPPAATTAAPAVATAPATEVAAPAPEALEGVMSDAEKAALQINDLAAEAAAADQADAAAAAAAKTAAAATTSAEESHATLAADAPTPIAIRPFIRLLELINAPASFIPDALRDTLGKVAILTMVNSIAVLIYVLFMRH